jgi:prophage regulatory protein
MITSTTARRERQELPKPLIYRERDLKALTSLSRKARQDAMTAGTFPRPRPLGPKARGWLVSEIEAWIEQRKAVRDADRAQGGTR